MSTPKSAQFTAALSTIAKTWKQPRCPSVGKWINQSWYNPENGILFSTKKINELSRHKSTRNNLKCI